jgi:hypothetical protein
LTDAACGRIILTPIWTHFLPGANTGGFHDELRVSLCLVKHSAMIGAAQIGFSILL